MTYMTREEFKAYGELVHKAQMETRDKVVIPAVEAVIKEYPLIFGLDAEVVEGNKMSSNRTVMTGEFLSYEVRGEYYRPIIGTILPGKGFWDKVYGREPIPKKKITGTVSIIETYEFEQSVLREGWPLVVGGDTINITVESWYMGFDGKILNMNNPLRPELTQEDIYSKMKEACNKLKPLVAVPK